MNRWILGWVVGAIVLVMAAGCGGGDDSTTTMTKAEFTKQASAICTEGKAELRAAIADYNKKIESTPNATSSPAYQREAMKVTLNSSILPAMREELAQLEELTAPAGEEATASELVKTFSLVVDNLEENGVRGLFNPKQYFRFHKEAKAAGIDCTA